jgi:hypothetical protein
MPTSREAFAGITVSLIIYGPSIHWLEESRADKVCKMVGVQPGCRDYKIFGEGLIAIISYYQLFPAFQEQVHCCSLFTGLIWMNFPAHRELPNDSIQTLQSELARRLIGWNLP